MAWSCWIVRIKPLHNCVITSMVAVIALTFFPELPVEVAAVVRYYYPPGDRRLSRHQVYVFDTTGNRRQITFGSEDCRMVRWVGRNALAWSERAGGREELWYSPYPRLNPRRVGSAKSIWGAWPRTILERSGRPIFLMDDKAFRVSSGRLIPVAGFVEWKEPGLSNDPAKNHYRPLNLDPAHSAQVLSCDPTGQSATFAVNGQRVTFPNVAGLVQAVLPTAKPGRSLLISELKTLGWSTNCYEVDWSAGTAIEQCGGYDLEIDFARGLATSIDGREHYAPYGPTKSVDAKGAYIKRFGNDELIPVVY
ncbi:MAG: hypothetical protein ACHQ50_01120, partial [Fimbriimonadales bacterium]